MIVKKTKQKKNRNKQGSYSLKEEILRALTNNKVLE